MFTVPHPASPFNQPFVMADYANDLLAGHAEQTARVYGHRDESTALLADPDDVMTPADVAEGMVAFDDDRAIQHADECAARDLRAARDDAKASIGLASITIARQFSLVDLDGSPSTHVSYQCMITGNGLTPLGNGATPADAVAAALADLDTELVPEFGGFKVPDRCLILAGHNRSKDEARDFARRIALDPTYLSVLLAHHTPGVINLQDDEPAAAVA